MVQILRFHTLSEKTLHHYAEPKLIDYCPSMDLVALVTTDQQVLIYRLNGQRVYGALQKAGNLKVESIKWKPNGLQKRKTLNYSTGRKLTLGQVNFSLLHGATDP
jgi:anaphase-promoting complex subunit 4